MFYKSKLSKKLYELTNKADNYGRCQVLDIETNQLHLMQFSELINPKYFEEIPSDNLPKILKEEKPTSVVQDPTQEPKKETEIWIGKVKDENNQNIAYEIIEEDYVKVIRVKDGETLYMRKKDLLDPFADLLDYKFGRTHEFITKLSTTLKRY